jgi:hypothetical protein
MSVSRKTSLFFALRVLTQANRQSCRFAAPAGEILSFASPKESIQRKGAPDADRFQPLRQRDASLHCPCGLNRSKAPVLGTAYGMRLAQIRFVWLKYINKCRLG